ncbi:MAG TPA: DUF3086 domain-containing protein [Stenomitos sp.]
MESSSISPLQTEAEALKSEILELKQQKVQLLAQQLQQTQDKLNQLLNEDIRQLEDRKKSLQITVEQLERRQERIQSEMRKTFAGASQEVAVRVQGFKDYLVTSLQDVALAAEQLELMPKAEVASAPVEQKPSTTSSSSAPEPQTAPLPAAQPRFASQSFQEETRQIRRLIEQYRTSPNYYGPPWQLRRTFEPLHAERVSKWFFSLGGRGAVRSAGTRLQNILVASAVISILNDLYGERLFPLILANSPERLGDWRRGLQDCLGIDRAEFGPDRGIALFESPEALAQKADRLVKDNDLPLILLDDSEDTVSLSVLQFPLWLAFVPDPQLRRDRQQVDWFE